MYSVDQIQSYGIFLMMLAMIINFSYWDTHHVPVGLPVSGYLGRLYIASYISRWETGSSSRVRAIGNGTGRLSCVAHRQVPFLMVHGKGHRQAAPLPIICVT